MVTSKTPMVDDDGEVRDLAGSDFKRARKASDAFPGTLQAKLGMLKSKAKPARKPPQIVKCYFETDSVEGDFAFSKHAVKAAQSYDEVIRLAADDLHFNVEGFFAKEPDVVFKHFVTGHLTHKLQMKIYDRLVHSAVDKFTRHHVSEDDSALTWLVAGDAHVKPSTSKLGRMRKSMLAELVQVQSEMLEEFKILFAVASSAPLDVAELDRSVLSEEMDKAGLAKRLRKIAQEVEMVDVPSRSRA